MVDGLVAEAAGYKSWKTASSEKVDEIETKLKDAETKLEKAKKELEEAEQKYEAKASVQAGPAQAGGASALCSCCCCLRFAAFPHGRRVSSCGPPLLLFGGHALLSARILACG